jgi:hypothetical protein
LVGWNFGQKQGKKEKKKETPIRSKPMYIRAREEKRQATRFPAIDYLRD